MKKWLVFVLSFGTASGLFAADSAQDFTVMPIIESSTHEMLPTFLDSLLFTYPDYNDTFRQLVHRINNELTPHALHLDSLIIGRKTFKILDIPYTESIKNYLPEPFPGQKPGIVISVKESVVSPEEQARQDAIKGAE